MFKIVGMLAGGRNNACFTALLVRMGIIVLFSVALLFALFDLASASGQTVNLLPQDQVGIENVTGSSNDSFKTSGTQLLGNLPVGSKVVDHSWEWQFRTGGNYSGASETKPVTWIVVAKNHYGVNSGVTLISEELIGLHLFDNSTNRGSSWGSNHWGYSGTNNATRGSRTFLNSTGIDAWTGFYFAFSESFISNIITTAVPNKIWDTGASYNTQDKVFIPSTTELGDTTHSSTYQIGTVYPYFEGSTDADRLAKLDGINRFYFTRSPCAAHAGVLRSISSGGSFSDNSADNSSGGLRPAINLSSTTLVSATPNAFGAYEIEIALEPTDFLYASFADAVYAYDGTDWGLTPVAHASALTLTAHGDNLYGAFGDGIYLYDGANWNPNKLTPGVATSLASYNCQIYGSFADATYTYDGTGTSWTVFHYPTLALAAYNGYLYASFTDAVYRYNGTSWEVAPVAHAPALALAAHAGNLYGAFGDGIYVYNGTSWNPSKVTSGVATNLVSYSDKLYGSFTDATYSYDGTSWTPFTWPTTALAANQ